MLDGLHQYERGQELLARAQDVAVCAWGAGSMQHLNVLYALAQHFRRRDMLQESIDFHEQVRGWLQGLVLLLLLLQTTTAAATGAGVLLV